VISLCTGEGDKQKPGVLEALQLVPRLIKGLCVREQMSPLTHREVAELEQQREIVADFLREQCDTYSLPRLKSDLGSLQRLVDDGFFGPEQVYEWCCVGVVFGDVLATEFDLDWVICHDEFGVEPALRYGDTSVMVFPRTLIFKRVERGEAVDLFELMDGLAKAIEDARRKC